MALPETEQSNENEKGGRNDPVLSSNAANEGLQCMTVTEEDFVHRGSKRWFLSFVNSILQTEEARGRDHATYGLPFLPFL